MRLLPLSIVLAATLPLLSGCSHSGSQVTVTGKFMYVGFTEGSEYFDQDLRLTGGDGCEGTGKYAGVRAGMRISVYDLQGNRIGQTTIGGGEVTKVTPFTDDDGSEIEDQPPMTTCSFPYSVQVPAMKNYVVRADGFAKSVNASVADGARTVEADYVADSTSE